jgi:hypothetical protein
MKNIPKNRIYSYKFFYIKYYTLYKMKPNVKVFINFRLFLCLIFWGLCILIHKNLTVKTYDLGMSINLIKQKPLYDIIQQNFPNLQTIRFIPEILHVIPVISLMGFIAHNRNEYSVLALSAFLINHAVLMLIRCIFFSVTLLPDSSEMCAFSTHIGSCFDLIFSGHSTIMYLCTYIINDYFYISRTVYSFFHINNILTCVLIITCRNHYTIDVLISIILTYLIYKYNKNERNT